MNCSVAEPLLNAYVDGELAPALLQGVEAHLASCGFCAQQVSDLQALQTALGAETLYHAAPGTLRGRVETALMASPPATLLSQPVTAKSLGVTITALAVLVGVPFLVWWMWFNKPALSLTQQTIRSHLRAVESNRLTEIKTSDPNAARNWLQSKGQGTVVVTDLSRQGYALQGARLEHLDGNSVPVLVYGSGKNTVNLYLWPSHCGGEQSTCTMSMQGLQVANWVDAGVIHYAVTDLPAERLEEFEKSVRRK